MKPLFFTNRPKWMCQALVVMLMPITTTASVTPVVGYTSVATPLKLTPPALPTLGDSDRGILTPIAERKLGEHIMQEIRRDKDYLDDAPLLEYLDAFGTKLVDAHPEARGEADFNYFFFAVRDPMLNAFALPGGFIAVHSGLILAAQTESELASVIAHEIGHVAQRHIARMLGRQSQDALLPLAGILLAVLASRSSPDGAAAAMLGGQGLALQRQLKFSRDAEREADRVGLQILQESNFDTSGMVAFFGRLQTASRTFSDLAPSFLLSHPLTSERIADIQARLKDQRYRQRIDSLDFYLVRARVRVLQAQSAQALQEASSILKEQTLQPDARQVIAGNYGLALIALRQRAPARAQALLQQAQTLAWKASGLLGITGSPRTTGTTGTTGNIAENANTRTTGIAGDSMLFQHLAIEIKLAAGPPTEAVREADAGRLRFPLSRGIAMQYADALIAAGKENEAIQYLRAQAQQYRTEPKIYERLAKAYAAKGKLALLHIALADSYASKGETQPALDQLGIARRTKDASFYDQSIIDALERKFQARRREEIDEEKKGR